MNQQQIKTRQVFGGLCASELLVYLIEEFKWLDIEGLSLKAIADQTGFLVSEAYKGLVELQQRGLVSALYPDVSKPTEAMSIWVYKEKVESLCMMHNLKFQKDPYFGKPRWKPTITITPPTWSGPWDSAEERKQFHIALVQYFESLGHPSAEGAAFKVVDSLAKGGFSPLWDKWRNGEPLHKPYREQWEWELEVGVLVPSFYETRVQYYVAKGEPLEQAYYLSTRDLEDPKKAKPLWEGFKRTTLRHLTKARDLQKQGVRTPYLPPAFSEIPTLEKEHKRALSAKEESLELSDEAIAKVQAMLEDKRPNVRKFAEQLLKSPAWCDKVKREGSKLEKIDHLEKVNVSF